MKMIPEWKKAWRYASTHIATVAICFGMLPEDTQATMLDAVGVPASRIPAMLGALFLLARVVQFKVPKA